MIKPKRLVSVAASICLTSSCVYGANLNIDYQSGTLSVNGSEFYSPTVAMCVLPANSPTGGSNPFYSVILELEADKNNSFCTQVNMPQKTQNEALYPSGYYTAYVYDGALTQNNETFLFINELSATDALNELKGKAITMDMLNTYKLELGISEDLSNPNINNEKLIKYINIFNPQTTLTSDDFAAAYISALLCGGMEYSFEDFMSAVRGNQGVLKCADNKFFNIDKSLQEKVYQKINQSSVISDTNFNLILCKTSFIEQINSENDDEIYARLITADYKSLLNMDMSSYNKLKSPENVILSLMDTAFSSVEQFKEAFHKAVANQKNAESKWEGGSSNGSGGSLSSGKFDGSYTPPSEDTKIPNTPAAVFSDAENHWAKDAIYYLKAQGIVNGVGNDNFMPDNKVTRAEFAKMIYSSFTSGISVGDAKFTDVKSSDWFNTYVCALSNVGIINGLGDGLFAPFDTITRQDAAVILKRTLDYKKILLSDEREAVSFNDNASISDYAKAAVDALYKSNLINGRDDMSFAPLDGLSRAEAAQMIYNILTKGVQ